MSNKRTILVVDDHTLFREGLKAIISRNPAYEVVGETGRGDSAVQMARTLRPDLVLVDISLPDQSGIEVALQLRKALPKAVIMMVTMHSKVDYIVNAFKAGATGFVTKDSAPERLLQAIEVVLKGEYFLDSAVSQKVVQRLAGITSKPVPHPPDNDIKSQTIINRPNRRRMPATKPSRPASRKSLLCWRKGTPSNSSASACSSAPRPSKTTAPASCANSACAPASS